jgi:predicted permease
MGDLEVPGRPGAPSVDADWNVVSPGFFELLGMPMIEGRTFTDADRAGVPRVAIVNEQLAKRVWPGESAIGRTLIQGDRTLTIVGVARDARMHIIGNLPQPYIFVPIYQSPMMRAELLVGHDAAIAPATVTGAVRQTVKALNPYLPVVATSTISEVAEFGMVPQRLAATLAGTLGIAGLLLAAIGLYGLMSYAVASRRREIGIRQALGADRSRIVRMFVRQGMKLATIGAGAGLVLGLALAFAIQGLLFGVSPVDPIALGVTIAAMLLVGLAASYFPARRASRVTPLSALRSE